MSPMAQSLGEISQEVECRRNFAIISHPDTGKTTQIPLNIKTKTIHVQS